jgi:hypothetical protein
MAMSLNWYGFLTADNIQEVASFERWMTWGCHEVATESEKPCSSGGDVVEPSCKAEAHAVVEGHNEVAEAVEPN